MAKTGQSISDINCRCSNAFWPEGTEELHHRLEELTELLGDDHDLARLGQFVMEMSTTSAASMSWRNCHNVSIGRRCEVAK